MPSDFESDCWARHDIVQRGLLYTRDSKNSDTLASQASMYFVIVTLSSTVRTH